MLYFHLRKLVFCQSLEQIRNLTWCLEEKSGDRQRKEDSNCINIYPKTERYDSHSEKSSCEWHIVASESPDLNITEPNGRFWTDESGSVLHHHHQNTKCWKILLRNCVFLPCRVYKLWHGTLKLLWRLVLVQTLMHQREEISRVNLVVF